MLGRNARLTRVWVDGQGEENNGRLQSSDFPGSIHSSA
jgi:hypothetical protein